MSVWDQHTDFLAEQAALLATQDELEAQGLLELMRNAYEKAREATCSKWFWTTTKAKLEIRDGQGRLIPPPYQSPKDPLPEDAFYSKDLISHIAEIFNFDDDSELHEALVEMYENWQGNKSKNIDLSSRFEVQRFDRYEVHRWLSLRGIESKYQFIPAISTSRPQPDAHPSDQRHRVNSPKSSAALQAQDLEAVEQYKTQDVGIKSPQATRRTWLDSCGDHVVDTQRVGRYGTAKDLFKALEGAARAGHGPFEVGQGQQRGYLVIKETRKTVTFKTLQNRWAEILRRAHGSP